MNISSTSTNGRTDGVFYLLVGGPLALLWGLRKLKEKRLIENTPTSKVRSAAMGLVELSGMARQHKAQKSPLSKMDACWWSCRVEELQSHGKSSSWVTLKQVASLDLFYLEDATGRVLINPLGAELHVLNNTFDLNASTRTLVGPVLNSWGLDDMTWFGGSRQLRIIEQLIPECAPLFIMGELIPMGPTPVPNAETMMVVAPFGSPFVVSTQEEQNLLSTIKWLAPLGIFGGISLSTAGVWLALSLNWNPLFIAGALAVGFVLSVFGKTLHVRFGRN